MDIDAYDVRIMGILAADGRLTMTELASQVGLTKTPVQSRVKRLEKSGYIKGYRALLDPVKMGLDHIAFVQVTLSDTRAAALSAFDDAVLKIPEVEHAHLIAGNFDYLLKVRTRDINDFRRVLGENISALPHVASTSSFVAMSAVKEKQF